MEENSEDDSYSGSCCNYDVNPSGHLSDTFAVSSVSAPAMVNFGVYLYTNNSKDGSGDNMLTDNNKGDWYLVESEGIYNGYKYYVAY